MCLYAEREAKNPCVVPAVWRLKPRPNETCEQVFANLILNIRQQIDLVVQGCITADNMPMAKCNPALVAWYKSQADVEEFCKLEDIFIDLTEMDSDDVLEPYHQIQLTTNAVRTPLIHVNKLRHPTAAASSARLIRWRDFETCCCNRGLR